MKRLVLGILIILLLVGVGACGAGEGDPLLFYQSVDTSLSKLVLSQLEFPLKYNFPFGFTIPSGRLFLITCLSITGNFLISSYALLL